MPRFFVPALCGRVVIEGEDARHIAASLRMQVGEELVLCDRRGYEAAARIEAIGREQVALQLVGEPAPSRQEPAVKLILYQALPKADKLELIAQKAVELGASCLVPVLTERCISRPDARSMQKKRERLLRIMHEAAKQCGRGRLPRLGPLMGLEQAAFQLSRLPMGLFFYEEAKAPLSQVLAAGGSPAAIGLLVGAEGGFSPREAALLAERGVPAVGLGPRILRCETAPLAALAVLLYHTGNL